MKRSAALLLAFCCLFTSLGCRAVTRLVSPSTVTPLPSPTAPPTATLPAALPDTPAPVPTGTPPPTAGPTAEPTSLLPATPTAGLLPSLPPAITTTLEPLTPAPAAASWKGLPVMPGAAGEQDTGATYMYTVEASPEAVEEFYNAQMEARGYSVFAAGQGDTQSKMLLYQKGSDLVTVVAVLESAGVTRVVLTAP